MAEKIQLMLVRMRLSLQNVRAPHFLFVSLVSVGLTILAITLVSPNLYRDTQYLVASYQQEQERVKADNISNSVSAIVPEPFSNPISELEAPVLGVNATAEGLTEEVRYKIGKLPIKGSAASTSIAREKIKLIATCADCIHFPVSKQAALPSSYIPKNLIATGLKGGGSLTAETVAQLKLFFEAAAQAGIDLKINSAYRSYATQASTFDYWYQREIKQGRSPTQAFENANRYSAQPGSSEHQLGTTADVACASAGSFDRTSLCNKAAWEYIAKNAHKYGFAISYPDGSEAFTGYVYEPWHIRYIGKNLASELYETGYLSGNKFFLQQFLEQQKLY